MGSFESLITGDSVDAYVALFPAGSQGDAGGRANSQPQADASRRHDPAGIGRNLLVDAAGP